MGIKRIVDVSFWTDSKIDVMSPEDKYFMLYLLSNPFSRQLGIYEISIRQVAFQLGYSIETVQGLLKRFEENYDLIRFSEETNEVAILNFLRHSVVKGGKPVEDCINKDMKDVKNKELIEFVFSRLYGRDDLNVTVKKIVNEYFNDNDNYNDNDNDESYHESYHESCKCKKYGQFNNVLLTNDELAKLKMEFPDYEKRIDNLSSYIASKGKKYSNHYATIKMWANNEKSDSKNGKPHQKSNFHNFNQRNYDNYDELERELLKRNKA